MAPRDTRTPVPTARPSVRPQPSPRPGPRLRLFPKRADRPRKPLLPLGRSPKQAAATPSTAPTTGLMASVLAAAVALVMLALRGRRA